MAQGFVPSFACLRSSSSSSLLLLLAMMLWVLGLFLSFAGLFVWLEFAAMFPRSGGEKLYLEAVYKNPRLLVTILFATNAILLGFTASGCIVFASNILVAADVKSTPWKSRGIAVGVIL